MLGSPCETKPGSKLQNSQGSPRDFGSSPDSVAPALQRMLFTDDFVASQDSGDSLLINTYFETDAMVQIQSYLREFLAGNERTESEFMEQLEQLYKLARIRYTKGGHKTN